MKTLLAPLLSLSLVACFVDESNPSSSSTTSALSSEDTQLSSSSLVGNSSSRTQLALDSNPVVLALPYDSISTKLSPGFYGVITSTIQPGTPNLLCPQLGTEDFNPGINDSANLYFCTSQAMLPDEPVMRWKSVYDPNTDSLTVIFSYARALNQDSISFLEPYAFNTVFKVINPAISTQTKLGFVQIDAGVDSNYIKVK
jgi:hypothetical protein